MYGSCQDCMALVDIVCITFCCYHAFAKLSVAVAEDLVFTMSRCPDVPHQHRNFQLRTNTERISMKFVGSNHSNR